ncbi:ABC transporter substrate-binding protein [Paenibacillus oceani]|uniref:Extracellular solute-binding protein n=1 Tax=Paenibacillus oceani TaxID=2772510 RepID=A0A927CF32_9BACL|nr:extracellular solute-binding protein [Paenibacillus oceani]MBD2866909.1 extracellular solute-binding protein [Paenibacillus oceani]
MNYKKSLYLGMAAMLLVLTACGQNGGGSANPAGEDPKKPEEPPQPVKLTIVNNGAGITPDNLEEFVLKPVRAKYPHITVELLTGRSLDQLITAGDTPDLVATSNYYMHDMIDRGLASDLNEFVTKEKTDLTKFEPEAINVLKSFGSKGELFGMPFAMNYGILAYNKDLFDKFGVPYPKDGMTWSETIELAKKMTRKDGDTQIIGLDFTSATALTRAYSLPTVDAKMEKPILDSEEYKKVFSVIRQIYDIPGQFDPKTNYAKDNIDFFLKDQKVAMQGYWLAALASRVKPLKDSGKDFNWDLVSFPSFDDRKGIGREVDFHLMTITPASKNKAAAYQVIQAMITDEAQKEMNKGSRMTAFKDEELRKQFASSMDIFKNKNLAGIFKVKPAVPPMGTKYDAKNYTYVNDAMKAMLGGTDINTALREANEKAVKAMEEEKQKAK